MYRGRALGAVVECSAGACAVPTSYIVPARLPPTIVASALVGGPGPLAVGEANQSSSIMKCRELQITCHMWCHLMLA